jgi:hypothetical protein
LRTAFEGLRTATPQAAAPAVLDQQVAHEPTQRRSRQGSKRIGREKRSD